MRFTNLPFFICAMWLPVVTYTARIVVIYSVGMKSHFFGIKPAIEALAERGHQITLFTPFKGIGSGILNVREVHLPETLEVVKQDVEIDWFAMQKEGQLQSARMFYHFGKFMRTAAKETLGNGEFRRIVAERDVDLYIVDSFGNEFAFPVIDLIRVPVVTHSSASPIPTQIAFHGGPPEYASAPAPYTDFTADMTFFQRLQNLVITKCFELIRELYWVPLLEEIVKEEYPEAIKSINEAYADVSLTIVNSHLTTTFPRSLPPTLVPIGALHTRPAKELPQDLKTFADNAKHGFIVFTLGSFVPVSSMPKDTAECFMRVFSKLPLNVVMKWESAVTQDVPSNILMVDWVPQQDLLGHPNAKLFITHGGMMGTQEAIYHGVPMLCLPFGNDQIGNIVKPIKDGYALKLDWDNLNDDNLFSAISYLVYDPKVRASAGKASRLMRDELVAGKDLAVYWIEYVMRNNGTKHLQLASKGMPFYKKYFVDAIAFFLVILFILLISFYLAMRFVFRRLLSSKIKVKSN